MDFQFTRYLGSVIARCSMEHEAAANWINIEARSNSALISQVLTHIRNFRENQYSTQEITVIGAEYSLFLNSNEVIIKANNLAIEDSNQADLEENLHYYDQESIASCGIEDFERFLSAYEQFNNFQ